MFLLFVPIVFGSGSLHTDSLLPTTFDLCGNYQQYVTITAHNITNNENTTLTSVNAKLYITGNSGLSFVTPQTVNLGNIGPLIQYSGSPSWTVQCNGPNEGTYTGYINYSTQNGYKASSYDEAVTVLTVHDSSQIQANISIVEDSQQQGETEYSIIGDNTPSIWVTTSKNAVCKGTLDQDESYQNMDFLFYGIQKKHNYTFTNPLSEGEHIVYVKCKDNLDNIMPNSVLVNFIVDTAGPEITVVEPGPVVVAEYTELKVTVNEESECRYDDDDDSFDDMEEFVTENSNTFSTQLTELEEEEYLFYVKCKDNVENIVTKEIEFEVILPPKAEIILETPPPLSAGTYELRLFTSKKLRTIPELKYSFTDETKFERHINLEKKDGYYKGHIIIEESDQTRSGVFSFRGYDLKGIEGTEITDGAIFLVDTVKPAAPQSVEAVSSKEGIILKWYYEGEKPDHYNIYRSTSQGVGYINNYDTTNLEEYIDEDVSLNQLYYYKVAAVDKAGNVGPLSKEINVYSESGSTQQSSQTNTKNTPTPDTREWKEETEKDLDTLLIDLDYALNNLKDQATREAAVDDISLVKEVQDATSAAEKQLSQLENLDLQKVSDTDLRTILSKADALVARTRKTTPQSLELDKSTSVLQSITDSDVELAVSELMKTSNYSDSQISSYSREMQKINDNVEVETEIKTITIEYIDETTERRVLVDKKFSYQRPDEISNVLAIEIIPKTVAGDISSIDIKTPDYVVLKQDPMIMWHYDTLSYDKENIKYVVLANDNSESAKDTKTVILVDPIYVINEKSLITGFSVFISRISQTGFEIFGVILGVVIVLGLGMYYLVVINDVDLSSYVERIPFVKNKQKKVKKVVEPKKLEEKVEEKPDFIEKPKENRFDYIFQSDNPIKTIPEQYFHVRNGDVIRSITEIPDVVSNLDEFTFYYHVQENGNDFADWVETVYHNVELADLIRKAGSREELLGLFRDLMN